MTQQEILSKIKQIVKQVAPNAEIWLFGSRARGDNRPDSDWDIIILVDNEPSYKQQEKF